MDILRKILCFIGFHKWKMSLEGDEDHYALDSCRCGAERMYDEAGNVVCVTNG